LVSNLA
jgi:transcriptional adapter 2-alpha